MKDCVYPIGEAFVVGFFHLRLGEGRVSGPACTHSLGAVCAGALVAATWAGPSGVAFDGFQRSTVSVRTRYRWLWENHPCRTAFS